LAAQPPKDAGSLEKFRCARSHGMNRVSSPQDPVGGLELFSCLRDGAPDAWGRRVIHARLAGRHYKVTDK